jgi:predicted site-specific integrase-resolvase
MTWITLPAAAKRLGIHRRTILRWYHAGRLPADALMLTPTGRWLVDVDKVPGLTAPGDVDKL